MKNPNENYFFSLLLLISFRYPPYSDKKIQGLNMLMKKRTIFGALKYLPQVAIFALGAATAIAVQAIVSVSA